MLLGIFRFVDTYLLYEFCSQINKDDNSKQYVNSELVNHLRLPLGVLVLKSCFKSRQPYFRQLQMFFVPRRAERSDC